MNIMRKLVALLITLPILASCKVEPEAINYGQDNCHHCKMTLMDTRYGAEIVTHKGKIYKFDDLNCMMAIIENGEVQHEDVKYYLVADFTNPETLLDANYAFYLLSDELKTPMASQVAAFPDEESMKAYQRKIDGGIYLAWGELVTQFK